MPNIYGYFNYRKYLSDYYTERKKSNSRFSYQVFTQQCGFKNKSFIHQIIHTSKQISKSSTYALSKALGLGKKEAQYFEHLVAFNQARNLEEKNHFYGQLTAINRESKNLPAARLVKESQYEYYSKWRHAAIRSLLDMYPFKDDYAWLAKTVYPAISVPEAKNSVRLLEKLDLIRRKPSGYYEVTDKFITTGDEVTGTAVLNFHRQTSRLAETAISRLPRYQRNTTGLTLGISAAGYQEICDRLAAFRKELLEVARQDKDPKMAYQLNLHFFPVSNPKLLHFSKERTE